MRAYFNALCGETPPRKAIVGHARCGRANRIQIKKIVVKHQEGQWRCEELNLPAFSLSLSLSLSVCVRERERNLFYLWLRQLGYVAAGKPREHADGMHSLFFIRPSSSRSILKGHRDSIDKQSRYNFKDGSACAALKFAPPTTGALERQRTEHMPPLAFR